MAKVSTQFSKQLLSAALLLSVFTNACGNQQPQAAAPPPTPVKLQTLERDTLEDTEEFVGTLEAKQRVSLASRIDGRIINILVEPGDQVTQGQKLVELQLSREQAEVNSRLSDVNAQRAILNSAEAALREAQANRDASEAELRRLEAEIQDREAELEFARVELERYQFLAAEGVQPRQELDDRQRNFNTATAQLAAAREDLNRARDDLNSAEQRVSAAAATVDSERANLSQRQAQVEVAEEDLEFNRIVAPINGVVGDIIPEVGDYISAGDQITTIIQNQQLDLNLNIPIEHSSQLRLGLPVELIDENNETGVMGEISFISPQADQQAQAILAKATFPNDGSLRDSQFVEARVIWQQQPGLLVPTTAISRIGGQSFVFVAAEETTEEGQTQQVARQTPVQLGDIQGQSYQVISGLEAGDQIAVSNILNLRDGAPITPESLASEQGSNNGASN